MVLMSYEMYTDFGDEMVHSLVVQAKAENRTWSWLFNQLIELSKDSRYSEATDTAVRECAYHRLGRFEEDFYV